MQQKNISFHAIYDVRAVRILVPEVRDCYAALGTIHTLWQYIPNEFDDYIATPKENGYRSLHTAVIGPEGRTLEIQIRTHAMHQEAELGVAAHWVYKEGLKTDPRRQKKNHLMGRIYVFTPKNEVIDLPQGATPLDFAYYIHTNLGHRCRGAKVNGAIVPLSYRLSSGEQVEILVVKEGGPSRDWLNAQLGYLHTSRARTKVHEWFKHEMRDENMSPREDLLEKENKKVEKLPKLDEIKTQPTRHVARRSEIIVEGIEDLLCHFAGCCKPVPGDAIVGYITLVRGVSVHRQDCINVTENIKEKNKLINVAWGRALNVYPVDIEIHAYERQGLLRDITAVLSDEKINIIAVNTVTDKENNQAHLVLTVEVANISLLTKILHRVAQLSDIIAVRRA